MTAAWHGQGHGHVSMVQAKNVKGPKGVEETKLHPRARLSANNAYSEGSTAHQTVVKSIHSRRGLPANSACISLG